MTALEAGLAVLIREAEAAHHGALVEAEISDLDWRAWYAWYLRADLAEALDSPGLTAEEIAGLLADADRQRGAYPREIDWPTHCARTLLEGTRRLRRGRRSDRL